MLARWSVPISLPFVALSAPSLGAQEPPALVEAGPTVAASRGSSARSFQIKSSILHETRPILVVLPASFAASATDRRYPVTVVLDGDANLAQAAAVSDELSRNGQIPEMVILAIPNTNRLRDLTPPGLSVSGTSLREGGDLFLDFIERELLPAADRQFRGGLPRIFIGHSSGGILATYAAATRATYRAVIAIDTPVALGENWLARQLTARAAAKPAPEPLRYVSYEARFGWPDGAWQTLAAAAPRSWRLQREKLARESHESLGMLSMYLGLREVFSDYSLLAAPEAPTTSILPYYAPVGEALGGAVVPPRKLLLTVLQDLIAEGRGPAARQAYEVLVSGYGAPADGAAILARIADAEHRPPQAETVEGLLATPFPTPAEARGYFGEWVGDVWMTPDEPRTRTLTLRVRELDGAVVGETVRQTAAGESVQRWQYLRITPAGMTWGNLNGMRPRGVMLFEGKLEGDTLTGRGRFGGIDFREPDGSPPPSLYFSFSRVRR